MAVLGPGSQLGPYRLETLLDDGPVAAFWRARRDDRTVFLHVLTFAPEAGTLRALAPRLLALAAPDVLPYRDWGQADGRTFFVAEAARSPLPAAPPGDLSARVALIGALAEALDGLAAVGLAHADLRDPLVWWGVDGKPALAGAGLALLRPGARPSAAADLQALVALAERLFTVAGVDVPAAPGRVFAAARLAGPGERFASAGAFAEALRRSLERPAAPRTARTAGGDLLGAAYAVRIESDPPGALVHLDGVPRGRTPLAIPRLREGDYHLRLTLAGHRGLMERVAVDRETSLRRTLVALDTAGAASRPARKRLLLGGFAALTPFAALGLVVAAVLATAAPGEEAPPPAGTLREGATPAPSSGVSRPVSTQPAAGDAREEVEARLAALGAENWSGRIEVLRPYVQAYVNDPVARERLRAAYERRGVELLIQARYRAARELYREAVGLFPENAIFRTGWTAANRALGLDGELVWSAGEPMRIQQEPAGDGWLVGASPWFLPLVFNRADEVSNFVLESEATLEGNGILEISFRQRAPDAYVWQIGTGGSRLLLWDAEARRRGRADAIATFPTSLSAGGPATVRLRAEGRTFALELNGQPAGTIEDDRLNKGGIGLAVRPASGEVTAVAVVLHQIRLYRLP
jgi:hypothetical protein